MEKQPVEEKKSPTPQSRPPMRPAGPNIWLVAIVLVLLVALVVSSSSVSRSRISYPFFREQVEADNVLQATVSEYEITGMFQEAPLDPGHYNDEGELVYNKKTSEGKAAPLNRHFVVTLPNSGENKAKLVEFLEENDVAFEFENNTSNALALTWLLTILLPLGLVIFVIWMFRRTQSQIMGGGFLSGFSKSPAKRFDSEQKTITFDDVAGLEGVKADLMEVVEFLRTPEKFQRLGGRIPKGVLLNGPPGTGKTLLARAVAGEAGVPYYSVSGSEFIQMFVGVGASRVRDLFKTAKENEPAIIFIDEIDAVGRQRGAGLGGGHDEREQTLNQILSEMDGFSQNDSVIVVAATNRPDVLDPALMRPGRFDRHVTVDRPTFKGRHEIFKVHVRDVPLADDVDLERLARGTMGLTGADIRNIVNEGALWATRHDRDKVYMDDFEYARDKVLMGATREEVIQGEEKEKTAYHEAGHALTAWLSDHADQIHKVTVVPRGRALGVTQTLPDEDRMSISQNQLATHLVFLLGGRAAERIIFGQHSAGAENDLERATKLARRMVAHWGMSEKLGPVSYKMSEEDPFLGREMHQQRAFSEHTMQLIDDEVARILHETAKTAEKLLTENRDKLDTLARALIDREELSHLEITELIGPSVRELAGSNGKASKKLAKDPA